MDPGLIAQHVMNGLMLGMIYALVAVGFTLFFGVLDVIKFSHGDVLTVGAFTALATFIGLQSLGVTSDALKLLVISVLRHWNHSNARWGHRACLRTAAAFRAGAQYASDHADARHRAARGRPPILSRRRQSQTRFRACCRPIQSASAISIFGSTTRSCWRRGRSSSSAYSSCSTAPKLGLAIRAVAQDEETARTMGVNFNAIVLITFAIGSALAAFAGLMNGLYYNEINFGIGLYLGVVGFQRRHHRWARQYLRRDPRRLSVRRVADHRRGRPAVR